MRPDKSMAKARENHLGNALRARALSGTGLLRQLTEILRLRYSVSSLGISEYYFYRLFDRQLSDEDRDRFAGYRRERIVDRALNKDSWRAIANDKLVFYSTLTALGLPYPQVRAVCHAEGRLFGKVPCLRTEDQIRRFLSGTAFPLFLKPVHGSYGRGACSAMAYDAASDALRLGNSEAWPLSEAAGTFLAAASHGYLFQDLVKPHESIRAFCRATASTVRVVVVLGRRGPEIFRCAWKIPTGLNMSDNFTHGETGNLLALVEPDSGVVKRVITGTGFRLRLVTEHPDTQQALVGFTLPDWAELRELCLNAATAYPGLRLQNWDIAIGDRGPVILEVNVEGSMDLHQLAGGRGILDGVLVEALADMGVHHRGMQS